MEEEKVVFHLPPTDDYGKYIQFAFSRTQRFALFSVSKKPYFFASADDQRALTEQKSEREEVARKAIQNLQSDKAVNIVSGDGVDDDCCCCCADFLGPMTVLRSLGTPGTDSYKRRFMYAASVFGQVIKTSSFIDDLDERTLVAFVREPGLDVEELDLFKAVCKWGIARVQRSGQQPTAANMRQVHARPAPAARPRSPTSCRPVGRGAAAELQRLRCLYITSDHNPCLCVTTGARGGAAPRPLPADEHG
jgi:hypothetical protein